MFFRLIMKEPREMNSYFAPRCSAEIRSPEVHRVTVDILHQSGFVTQIGPATVG